MITAKGMLLSTVVQVMNQIRFASKGIMPKSEMVRRIPATANRSTSDSTIFTTQSIVRFISARALGARTSIALIITPTTKMRSPRAFGGPPPTRKFFPRTPPTMPIAKDFFPNQRGVVKMSRTGRKKEMKPGTRVANAERYASTTQRALNAATIT